MVDQVRRYKDNAGEWRWRRVDLKNHKEVGAATEGYINYKDMDDNAHRINGPESGSVQYIDWLDE